MRFAFITDIHEEVQRIEQLAEAVGEIELLIVGGDLTNFGGCDQAREIVALLRAAFPELLCLAGNLDHPSVEEWLSDEELSLHGNGRTIAGVGFFGCGGSNPTPMHTPYELDEQTIADVLTSGHAQLSTSSPRVLVSHTPPLDTKTDRIYTGKHVGSQAVRRFLLENDVDLCLCGHIHESKAIDALKDTVICNPGPFSAGYYALVERGQDDMSCAIHQLPVGHLSRIGSSARVIARKVHGLIRHRRTTPTTP